MLLMLQVDNLSDEADLEIYRALLDGYFKSEGYQCPTEILDLRAYTGTEYKFTDTEILKVHDSLRLMRRESYANNVVAVMNSSPNSLAKCRFMQECDRYMVLERVNGELLGRFLKHRSPYSDKIKLSVVFRGFSCP